MKELLIKMNKENLDKILIIQRSLRWKKKDQRLNVKRFKELLLAFITGWKVRRVMAYLKTLPEFMEAMDFVHLKMYITNENSDGLLTKNN
mmetsp:Transcript_31115/g.27519  ORF Transcript_31115/g.27519 Transcript_31115/m.27519 type:complete len:90 (+) Transcript_31115:459-728(+)